MIIQAERTDHSAGLVRFKWAELTASDTASHIEWAKYADRSVQMVGAATVVLQGSNDGDNWATLHDLFGNPAMGTGGAIMQVAELTLFIRPVVFGAGTATVIMVAK